MAVTNVRFITPAAARKRRAEIIRLAGGDEEVFRLRAEGYLLDADQRALFDELEDLDYLLSLWCPTK